MKTQNFNAKEPVRLRSKRIKNGNLSLYLDVYFKGQRKYEFLRLYLIPEQNRSDREYNRRCLQLAHAIRTRRLVELQESLYTDKQILRKRHFNLLDYINLFVQDRKKAYRSLALGLKNHLMHYKGDIIPFCDINKSFLLGFHRYLNGAVVGGNVGKHQRRLLSQGTRWNYFNIFSRLLNKAYREGYLISNPMHELNPDERPRRADPKKTYLVLSEVRKLAGVPLKNHPEVKQAFLFSCLCGLRFSDVKRLQWNNLQTDSKGNTLAEIIQQKTGSRLYLPISAGAMKQLPQKGRQEGLVFKRLPDASYTGKILKKWIQAAGIRKNVTFHCGRHLVSSLYLKTSNLQYMNFKLLTI